MLQTYRVEADATNIKCDVKDFEPSLKLKCKKDGDDYFPLKGPKGDQKGDHIELSRFLGGSCHGDVFETLHEDPDKATQVVWVKIPKQEIVNCPFRVPDDGTKQFLVLKCQCLFVNPGSSVVPVGQAFIISVDVLEITDMVAFDFTLLYDSTQLTTSQADVGLAGTLFDDLPHTVLARDVSDSLGRIRIAATLLGTTVSVGRNESKPLAFVTFRVDAEGTSALDLTDDTLVSLVGGVAQSVSHFTGDGMVQTPPSPSVFFKSWGVKSSDQVLKLSSFERSTELQSRLLNNGTVDGYAQVVYVAVNSGGLRIGLLTACTLVTAQNGTNNIAAEMSATLIVDPIPDTWFAFAILRVGSMPDCSDARPREVRTIVSPFIVIP